MLLLTSLSGVIAMNTTKSYPDLSGAAGVRSVAGKS